MAGAALLEPQPGGAEDPVVEPAAVVDDDHDPPAGREGAPGAVEDLGDRLAVAGDAAPDLVLVPALEAEQLEGVDVLLVVVDQARVGRRGDDEVDRARAGRAARASPCSTVASVERRTSSKASTRETASRT